jgi:Mg2+ and Co2+ transporter CorA
MEDPNSCEGYVLFTYNKADPLCNVCKAVVKKTKRKLHSSGDGPSSFASSKTRNNLLDSQQLQKKVEELAGAVKKGRVVVNRYKKGVEKVLQEDEEDYVMDVNDKIRNIFERLKSEDFDLKAALVELITTNCAKRISRTRSLTAEQKVLVFTFPSAAI